MMEYYASITYRNPVPVNAERAAEAAKEKRLLGQQCPVCGRMYAGGRGYCPIDSVELTEEHDVDLPAARRPHQLHDRHAGAVPGPDRDRAVRPGDVRLDGVDVVLGYQALLDMPDDDVRVGMRVAAMWASEAELEDQSARGQISGLVGWMPTGEPDDTSPDLVNKVL